MTVWALLVPQALAYAQLIVHGLRRLGYDPRALWLQSAIAVVFFALIPFAGDVYTMVAQPLMGVLPPGDCVGSRLPLVMPTVPRSQTTFFRACKDSACF